MIIDPFTLGTVPRTVQTFFWDPYDIKQVSHSKYESIESIENFTQDL